MIVLPLLGRQLVITIILLLHALTAAEAARRPRYGGTLRVKTAAALVSLDPAEWPAVASERAVKERLITSLFEPLVRLDAAGQAQPCLAVSWDHDPSGTSWSFRIRERAKFHDGSPLTPAVIASVLVPALKKLRVSVSGDAVTIRADQPTHGLLSQLAAPTASIVLRKAGGNVVGTGPFRLAGWEPGRRFKLAAHEEHWDGRPFLDGVEVEMRRSLREQLIDLELGKADIVEIPLNEVRSSSQRGLRIWSSVPVELMALLFRRDWPAVQDVRLRQALSLSIDRLSIHNVLLQKQGQPSGSLLPQRLSGFAFLFAAARDLEQARALSATRRFTRPLLLGYEPQDILGRTIAERLALNAREAGILLHTLPASALPASAAADLRLLRVRLASANPEDALAQLAALLGLPPVTISAPSPEALYTAEKLLLEDHWVIPLFHLPVTYGLSPQVRNAAGRGLAAPQGGQVDDWPLEELWLDGASQPGLRVKP